MVGLFIDAASSLGPFPVGKPIVVLGALPFRGFKAVSDLKALHRPDGKNRLRQIGIQLVKDRLSDSGRKPVDPALHHAANGIADSHLLLQIALRRLRRLGIRHIEPVAIHLIPVKLFRRNLYRPDGAGVGPYLNPQLL